MRMGVVSGALRSVDLARGTNERLLQGIVVTAFDISPDGKQLVYSAEDAGRRSEIWLSETDGSKAARRLSSAGDMFPRFGKGGTIYFTAVDRNVNYLYWMQLDGSGRQQVSKSPILVLLRVSPDGKWAFVWGHDANPKEQSRFFLVPTDGGQPVDVCGFCSGSWSPDGKLFYLYPEGPAEYKGQTFVLPFENGPPPALMAGFANTPEKRCHSKTLPDGVVFVERIPFHSKCCRTRQDLPG